MPQPTKYVATKGFRIDFDFSDRGWQAVRQRLEIEGGLWRDIAIKRYVIGKGLQLAESELVYVINKERFSDLPHVYPFKYKMPLTIDIKLYWRPV